MSDWLDAELARADADDPGPDAARVRGLPDRHRPVVMDMGHARCNEIAHDGRTIRAAAGSTGEAGEGPVGFTISAVDGVAT